MYKKLIYFSFSLILFASCEEYYTPHIDLIDGQLVVEAQITNNPSKNFVRLTKTRGFYDTHSPAVVSGASVVLVEINGNVTKGIENSIGYFQFNTVPVSGKKYKLRIIYQNDTYESEEVTMPPLPVVLSAYSGNKIERYYRTDAYGVPQAFDRPGREIYFDLSATNTLSYYRFDTRAIIEWIYYIPMTGPPPPNDPPPPNVIYGWHSYYFNERYNIAGPKAFSHSNIIEKHPLLTLADNAREYLQSDTLLMSGWILIIDLYGTTKGSFDFHGKLNSQFAADGSLFDPVQTQIYGNITCITNPSKIVFGYFDLNSYQQNRYYINLDTQKENIKLRQIFRYPDIPEEGQILSLGSSPDWWER
ncbi:MAG: DUF4249 family protein [Bacteroidia bacterium]|nr:DUF4249 family protein [Bacteroidia bacterium]